MECIPGCTECCWRVAFCGMEVEGLTATEEAARQQLTFACPFVEKDVGCKIYEKRGLVCRLFGTNTVMACPRGAKAKNPLTPAETIEILETYRTQFFEGGK